ncbi:MAG: hypothetical protein Aurels2KO_06550 [Aureliella sp.]
MGKHSELTLLLTAESEIECGIALARALAIRNAFSVCVIVSAKSPDLLERQVTGRLQEIDDFEPQVIALGTDPLEVVAEVNRHLSMRLLLVPGLQEWGDMRRQLLREVHSTVVCFETHKGLLETPDSLYQIGEDHRGAAKWFSEQWTNATAAESLELQTNDPNEGAATVLAERSAVLIATDLNGIDSVRKVARRAIDELGPPILVVRGEFPSMHWWLHCIVPSWVAKVVPQMDRETRRTLTDTLTTYSRLDFEFIALICSATFLASFGLVQNSAAVIIGAMLVAPLMTPILGAGLSLAQGNRPLFAKSLKTIIVGFVAALLTSAFFGCLLRWTPNEFLHRGESGVWLTDEMWSRTTPGILDFLVGAVGGSAAAFARTRGHLSSALAGAAIAAALVPPIATAGLQLSLVAQNVYIPDGSVLAHNLIYGPALLFVANMLTIMIGASIVLWSCGVRGEASYSILNRWSSRMISLLLLLTAVVAVWIVQHP